MISVLSNHITHYLLKKSVISDEDKELYDYGIFMMMSYIVFFIISLLFGLIFKIPFSSIIFYLVFCLIRNFAGGIHANSEIKCNILTTISIFISILSIKIFKEYELIWIAFVMLIISSVSLCAIKPVASSQKEISQQDKSYYHRKVVIFSTLSVIVSLFSIIFEYFCVMFSFSVGLSLASFLLVVAKVRQNY